MDSLVIAITATENSDHDLGCDKKTHFTYNCKLEWFIASGI